MAINWTIIHKHKPFPVEIRRVETPEEMNAILEHWRRLSKGFGRHLPELAKQALNEWHWPDFIGFGTDVYAMFEPANRDVLCILAVEYNGKSRTVGDCLCLHGILKCPSLILRFRRHQIPFLHGKVQGVSETKATFAVWRSREFGTKGRVAAPAVLNVALRDTLEGIGFVEVGARFDEGEQQSSFSLEIGEYAANHLLSAWE